MYKYYSRDYSEYYTCDVTGGSTGLWAKYNLPEQGSITGGDWNLLETMSAYIRGKARVSNYTMPTAFNLFTQYQHTHGIIQPSFTWSTTGIDVGFIFESSVTEYPSYCYVNYVP